MFRDVRISFADGELCTMSGACWGECCMCQACPICMRQRVPLVILNTYKHRLTKAGAWTGPHCLSCDMVIWSGGRDIDYPSPDSESDDSDEPGGNDE